MGRVLAQVEQTSTPVPAQACVHVDDEELQIVQDERYGHYLFVERCRARVGDGSRDPKDKVGICSDSIVSDTHVINDEALWS